jgi:hypothetical protein
MIVTTVQVRLSRPAKRRGEERRIRCMLSRMSKQPGGHDHACLGLGKGQNVVDETIRLFHLR